MSSPLKDSRIELRVTGAQKAAIEEAAAIEGRTVTDFSTSVLTAEAEAVIRRERELRVEGEAFDRFRALLDQPATSVEGLRELLSRPSVFVD
jgi:uncharacterized protein (DUF1778 family)